MLVGLLNIFECGVGVTVEQLIGQVVRLAGEHGLDLSPEALEGEHVGSLACFPNLLGGIFSECSVGHFLEQGGPPQDYYPGLFYEYVASARGELDPQDVEINSDDAWESLRIHFALDGIQYEIHVEGVDNSDWFSPDFVAAMNLFAETKLSGRWVDFYDQEDWCTSLYVPAVAYTDFCAVRDQFQSLLEQGG